MLEILKSPWTDEQVAALERRQEDSQKHPYTCQCGHSLVPTREGWECDECPYTQNWCHAMDVAAETKGASDAN